MSDDAEDEPEVEAECPCARVKEASRIVMAVSLASSDIDSSSLSDDSASGAACSWPAEAAEAEWAATGEGTRAQKECCEDPSAPSEAMDPEAIRKY